MNKFPWQRDDNGEYLIIASDEIDRVEVRTDSSFLFIFVGKLSLYNHIWIERPDLGETEDTVMGIRIWQKSLDDKFGEGSFISLADQMMDRGFMMAEDEEPSDLDKQAFHNCYPNVPDPLEVEEDSIVMKAISKLDEAWKYYSVEWT